MKTYRDVPDIDIMTEKIGAVFATYTERMKTVINEIVTGKIEQTGKFDKHRLK